MRFEHWGTVDYLQALERQLQYVHQIAEQKKDEVVVLCSHPAVVTLGRASQPEDLCGWSGPVYKVGRGGRATYHGPGQLVIYPLLNLKRAHQHIGVQDVRQFLRQLESALVGACSELVETHEGEAHKGEAREGLQFRAQQTGVWCHTPTGKCKKIASIGIGVKKWCTYHGAALNVRNHPIKGIKACGMEGSQMSSLEQLRSTPRPLCESTLLALLKKHLNWALN